MTGVDYDFYSCNYGGMLIPREVFGLLVRRAEVLLANMVRVQTATREPEKLKFLLCEICDRLFREDQRAGVIRESLDGYDVTYAEDVKSEIVQLVRRHLGDSGALYRGR